MDRLSYQTGASEITFIGLAKANFAEINFDGGAGKKDRSTFSGLRSAARQWAGFKRGLLSLLVLLLLVPSAGAAYQFLATRMDQRTYLPGGQLTNVSGYMLHIHCTGQGSPTILLEGGLGGTSLDWSLVQPALSTTTRVCSYDRGGLGWSENNPSDAPRTSSQIAAELHTLLRNTGIEGPYILAGLSAGGMHVQMFADRYPDEVLGLVLVDPTPAKLMASFPDEQRPPLLLYGYIDLDHCVRAHCHDKG